MLGECGDGGAQQQRVNADSADDVTTGLRRGQEHLHVRFGCIGLQQWVAAGGTWTVQ